MANHRLFGRPLAKSTIFLALVQAGIAMAAVYLATWLRLHGTVHLQTYLDALFPRALVFTLGFMLCLVAVGLYRHQLRGGPDQIVLQTLVASGLAAVLLSAAYYMAPALYIGRGILALADLIAFAGVATTHVLYFSILDQETFKRRVLIYGAGDHALSLLQRMQRKSDRRLFRIVGCIPVDEEQIKVDNEPLIHLAGQELDEIVHAHKVDEIVIVPDERRRCLPLDALLRLRMEGVQVSDAVSFYERSMGKLKTDLMDPAWIIFSEGFEHSWGRQVSKRAFDLLFSLFILLLSWPFMLLAMLAIWAEEGVRAPVLYRQTRVGLNGRPFQILKFRSMRVDAEADGKARWASSQDDRVTRVGAFIRKYRLDELPQLFNVFVGQMSLIGPRPERPEFVQELRRHIHYYDLRHHVRPGVTGWAQLSYPYGATDQDALEKLQFDLYYVKNANLMLDLYILLETVEVVLLGKGGR